MSAPHQQLAKLHEALDLTQATLFAIEAMEAFVALPENGDARAQHNHGLTLLHGLADALTRTRAEIDALPVEG